MKKIGIDARLYSQTGVGTYLKNLIHYLDKKELKDDLFYIYLMPDDYNNLLFKNNNIIKRKVNYRWHTFGEQVGFAIELYKDNLDLMHFTYFSYPILYRKKFIATVHDLTPLLFKTGKASTKNSLLYKVKYFFYKIILKTQIKKATKILTPSKTVRDQLLNKFDQSFKSKIFSIHLGVDNYLLKSKENILLKNKINYKFFIYVGNFYPHKNVEKLILAFSMVKTSSKLLLLGPNDFFKNRLFQLINRLKQEKRILFINSLTTEDLIYFYKNAEALIHPSLSEGFGLPLIEAAYFNRPIIASNIKVFKELLGDNYLSFNPNDIDDIVEKIKSFIEKKPNKFDYKNIIKKYSFKKMTDETVKIYREVLNGN